MSTSEYSLDEESTDDGHYTGVACQAAGYSLHACVECGRELAEALIKYNQEGFAATVLEECLMLTGVPKLASKAEKEKEVKGLKSNGNTASKAHFYSESGTSQSANTSAGEQSLTNLEPSTIVALLARRCEVLLCVWDLLLRDAKETARTEPFPSLASDQYATHYEEIRRESIASLVEMMSPSKASVIQSLADAPVDYSADIKTKAGGVRPGGQLDLSLRALLTTSLPCFQQILAKT